MVLPLIERLDKMTQLANAVLRAIVGDKYMQPVPKSESDFLHGMISHVTQKLGIVYTEDINVFASLTGISALSHAHAVYCNPVRRPTMQVDGKEREFIGINSIMQPNDLRKIALFFHELAHATGHVTRLDRPAINLIGGFPYEASEEEVLAETIAMMLMEHFGLANEGTREISRGYIAMSEISAMSYGSNELSQARTKKNTTLAFEYILNEVLNDFTYDKKEEVA
jgi:hypothetical protein